MGMNKQALPAVHWFLLYCFLHSLSSECTSSEEKFYTVGIETFRIQEERDFTASRSLVENAGLQDKGREEARDLTLSYLQPPSNSSWKDTVFQGLERDKRLVNNVLAIIQKNNKDSSGGDALNVPVKSGNEIQGPEYTVTVRIGTPPAEQLMGIDTLGSLSWIQCRPCRGCSLNVTLGIYEPNNSDSFRSVNCKTSKCPPLGSNPADLESKCDDWDVCTYIDTNGISQGSEGDYITDTLQLGPDTIKDFYMGCAYGFSPPRVDATSGHLALGRGPLSVVSQKYGGQFSYCLPNYLSVRATGSLTLGNGSIPSSVKVFTPMQKVADFFSSAYILGLEGISVGGERLRVSMQVPGALPTITFIDASVMATRLIAPVFEALRDSFEKKLKTVAPGVKPAQAFGDFRPCYQLSSLKSVKIPIVTLHLKGNATVDVPDVGTLLQIDDNRVRFPFVPSDNDAVNIIGNVQQQGLRVAFDNANNRVGFSRGSC